MVSGSARAGDRRAAATVAASFACAARRLTRSPRRSTGSSTQRHDAAARPMGRTVSRIRTGTVVSDAVRATAAASAITGQCHR